MRPPTFGKDQILDAAEDLLRQYGLEKTNIVDVAKALGVSQSAVYKHFPTKNAVREAVAQRWLHRLSKPLQAVADRTGPAPKVLRAWFLALIALKRKKVRDDRLLFETYRALAETTGGSIVEHIDVLLLQITNIMERGIEAGEFRPVDPKATAVALLNGTSGFHHPHFVSRSPEPTKVEIKTLLDLLLAGLAP